MRVFGKQQQKYNSHWEWVVVKVSLEIEIANWHWKWDSYREPFLFELKMKWRIEARISKRATAQCDTLFSGWPSLSDASQSRCSAVSLTLATLAQTDYLHPIIVIHASYCFNWITISHHTHSHSHTQSEWSSGTTMKMLAWNNDG